MTSSITPFHKSVNQSLAAMAPAGSPLHSATGRAVIESVVLRCRKNLFDQVLPFWETRVHDPENSGLFHYFDQAGNLTSTDKSTWCQGRMTYTFSLLALEHSNAPSARKQNWLNAATAGRNFVLKHAYAGAGRWNYLCSRDGKVIDGHKSAYSDSFALMGLCTYALAAQTQQDIPIIKQALSTLESNLKKPGFNEYHHFNLDPKCHWHGPSMVAIGLVPLARAVLGDMAVQPLADWTLNRVLYYFANDEHKMLLEQTDHNGNLVNTPQGRTTNPGHTLESMWFCLEEALHRRNQKDINRILQIVRWAFDKGWDNEYGGLFAFVDVDGGQPHEQDEIAWGDRWSDKLWWVHSEAIYTLALAAALSSDSYYLNSLQKLTDWTLTHLTDKKYGEWYLSTSRDGKPEKTLKGNVFRSAFHVPRSLLKISCLDDALTLTGK